MPSQDPPYTASHPLFAEAVAQLVRQFIERNPGIDGTSFVLGDGTKVAVKIKVKR